MNDDQKIQIELSVDGTEGVKGFDALGQAAGRFSQKVRTVADSGGQAIDSLAGQASQAALAIDGAAANMQQSIARVGRVDGSAQAGLNSVKTGVEATRDALVQAGTTAQQAYQKLGDTARAGLGLSQLQQALLATGKAIAQLNEARLDPASKGTDAITSAAKAANSAYAQLLATLEKVSGQLSVSEKQLARPLINAFGKELGASRTDPNFLAAQASIRGLDPAAFGPAIDQLRQLRGEQDKNTKSLNEMGLSARQTTAALRQVPMQITDIVVSLASGQSPMLVLLQQGGQLRDIFGSIRGAAVALGRTLIGFITPVTTLVAAIAGLGAAYLLGRKESEEYTKALILSGNAAGTTSGQLSVMAQQISAVVGTTGKAAQVLAQLAATGQLSATSFEKIAVAAVLMEKATGQAIETTVQQFVELQKAPLQASLKLNEATNFLTRGLYEQIKALEDSGRQTEAANLAVNNYADTMASRTKDVIENAGLIERAWLSVVGVLKQAVDLAKDVGRPKSLTEQYQEASARLREMQGGDSPDPVRVGIMERLGYLDTQRTKVENLREAVRNEARAAQNRALEAQIVKDRASFDSEGKQYLSKAQQLKDALERARGDLSAKVARGSITQREMDQRLADIRTRFTDKGAESAADKARSAQLARDIAQEKNLLNERAAAYATANVVIDSLRQEGLLNDQQYFDQRQLILKAATDAQRAEVGSEIKRFDDELKRLGRAKEGTADFIRIQTQRDAAVSRLNVIEQNAVAAGINLDRQRVDSLSRVREAYIAAEQAQAAFLADMQKEINREVSSFGMGREERRRQSARGQINDKYDRDSLRVQEEMAARRRIQNGRLTDDQEQFFQNELSMIEGYRDKAVKAYEDGFSRMKEAQADWRIGASVSIKDYFNDATNAAQNTAEVFQKSFSAMEDALTKFVTTGKLDWKNLGDTIAQEITRMVIRWQIGQAMMAASGPGGDPSSALINLAMSLFGGGGNAPATSGAASAYSLSSGSPVSNIGLKMRAYGGPVEAGQMYEVNERGPELLSYGGRHFLMMGKENGQVSAATPSAGTRPQPVTNITVNVTPPAGSSRETASQWGAAAGRHLQNAMRRNG